MLQNGGCSGLFGVEYEFEDELLIVRCRVRYGQVGSNGVCVLYSMCVINSNFVVDPVTQVRQHDFKVRVSQR